MALYRGMTFQITGDTTTEYLDKLLTEFNEGSDDLLEDIAYEVVAEITEFAPSWNPNLLESGDDMDNWSYTHRPGLHTLEILYTGFTPKAESRDLKKGVWWEFGDPSERELKRDYAYFQETGIDPVAKPEKAKSKFFVKRGTVASAANVYELVEEYFEMITAQ